MRQLILDLLPEAPPTLDNFVAGGNAEAVAALVAQMREEQKTVRQWAQNQQLQQNEIQRLLLRIGGQPTTAGLRTRISEE